MEDALARGAVGPLLFVTDPPEINRLHRFAIEGNRLGIPALFGFDVIHGLRTIFPGPIAMAASWDDRDHRTRSGLGPGAVEDVTSGSADERSAKLLSSRVAWVIASHAG